MEKLLSDERLCHRLASGEAVAFDELYRRYAHRLSAYAGSLLGDRAAGEDVAQVALLSAYQALRKGLVPTHVRPWLFRIAHNESVDMLARRRELLHGLEGDEQQAPDDGSAARGALLTALQKLPDRQRRAYVLREVHGLRVAEISTELSLSVSQVEQALFAARNRLAEELVFGDGLTCDAARRLSDGPLVRDERRALKRHFRTCDSCRAAGFRTAPALTLDWARWRIADLLIGGAAPAAAKIGAVTAATVVTGAAVVPVVADPPRSASELRARAAATTVGSRRPVALAATARPVTASRRAPTNVARGGEPHAVSGHSKSHASEGSREVPSRSRDDAAPDVRESHTGSVTTTVEGETEHTAASAAVASPSGSAERRETTTTSGDRRDGTATITTTTTGESHQETTSTGMTTTTPATSTHSTTTTSTTTSTNSTSTTFTTTTSGSSGGGSGRDG